MRHSFILCFMSLWQLIIFSDNNVKCSSVFVFKSICIYRVSQKKVGSQKISNCSNSLNFEAKINCNTIKPNVPKWRKTCTGLKFDLLNFYGPQSNIHTFWDPTFFWLTLYVHWGYSSVSYTRNKSPTWKAFWPFSLSDSV